MNIEKDSTICLCIEFEIEDFKEYNKSTKTRRKEVITNTCIHCGAIHNCKSFEPLDFRIS